MGKKSRRPNRNKQKDNPVSITAAAVAASATLERDQLLNQMRIFNQLFESRDWEGILQLVSTGSDAATIIENTNPSGAGRYYYNLGIAHKKVGREGGIAQAIACFQKGIEMAKKLAVLNLQAVTTWALTDCFIETGRIQEAMDLYKSLVADIGKERLDPDCFMGFVYNLNDSYLYSHSLEVLEEHLDIIESTWDKPRQARAYGMIADTSTFVEMYDYNKSNVYYERQLSIAKDIKDLRSEAEALHGLGGNHRCMGDYDKAMEFLEQVVPLSEAGEGRVYYCMGDVLLAQDGLAKEAIAMLQKASGILETCNDPEVWSLALHTLGEAYTQFGAWDDAITAVEKSISILASMEFEVKRNELQIERHRFLGRIYLEKYYSRDEFLIGVPEIREEAIRKASLCSQESINLGHADDSRKPSIYLDLAQAHYFLGDTEKAQAMLKEYLDQTVKLGPSHCEHCHQPCPKDAHMEKCSDCKVARYCSRAHSIEAWQKYRLCHKVMCPLLKRWRKLQVGKATGDSHNSICNDFFEILIEVSPVATPHPYASEMEVEPYKCEKE